MLLLVGLMVGCAFEPEGASRFDPPAIYRTWWADTEACSGLKGNFHDVTWASVPGRGFACPSGTCVGRWESGQHIYLAEAYQMHELVVRHEMLHALVNRTGHPAPPFGKGCALTWETWFEIGREGGAILID